MGGEHYVFEIDGERRLVHGGGHGEYPRLLPQFGAPTTRWFVAEVIMVPPRSADADGNPDSSRAGWCLDRLPPFEGQALRLVPAAGRDDAQRLLATITATGLPRALVALAPAAREDLAVVRITQHAEVASGRRYQLEQVEGDAPAWFDVPVPPPSSSWLTDVGFAPWTGDLLVVATTGAGAKRTVTRAMVADDLADARRWAGVLRTTAWPPAWILAGPMGAFVGARWAAVGKVVKGRRGCGLELEIKTHDGTPFVLDPMRVAVPAGVARGNLVTAVVVPADQDRCGRVARVVRAYKTPGVMAGAWLVSGEAAPAAPTIE